MTNSQPADYDPNAFRLLHDAESLHFWFDARRRQIMKHVAPKISVGANVLEVGAGTGYVAEGFFNAGYCNYVLGDVFGEALQYTKSTLPDVAACQFDVFRPPFRPDFDAVFLFDVIEHLEDDTGALRSVASVLRGTGRVAITVPAHSWLWHADDRSGGHKRRYNRALLTNRLAEAGFEVESSRFFFTLVLPFLFVRRLLSPDRGDSTRPVSSEFLRVGKLSNPIFNAICRLENRMQRFIPNVFGGSLLVVARLNDVHKSATK